jgi:phytoene dehydrogenase-like protein
LLEKRDYDAVVVGSGPNGLAAAITMQQAGLSVILFEAKETLGGGMRTAELTLPGFKHDICSAIHPLGADSPFFKTLPLEQHGLEYIYPPAAAAHPFDDGQAAMLYTSVEDTARTLGEDANAYAKLAKPLVKIWPSLAPTLLGPLRIPSNPLLMAQFGIYGILPSTLLAQWQFKNKLAKGLFAGMAAHSILPLTYTATSALGLVLMLMGHIKGWPLPKGGSQNIAQALASYFTSIGGKVVTNFPVRSLEQLPSAHTVLFDITPKQLLQIAGHRFSSYYTRQLKRFKYGMGVFKVDFALDGPVPYKAPECLQAGTVHLGNTLEEIAAGEQAIFKGIHPEKPYVLLAQQSLFDPSRAPAGKHTLWAYCHVPNGSTKDMTTTIENQIERFAPGFRDRIIGRHTMNTTDFENYNSNYIGGDINGGRQDITQLFTRPVLKLSPYRTSSKGLYICSSSTPPGGGVHGMCGYHAAKRALKDIFNIKLS